MPEGVEVKIEGMDELIKKLDDLGKMSTIHAGMKAAANVLKGQMIVYPAKTEANVPKHFAGGRWYQRGWGSKWFTRKGIKGIQSSEDLKKKWTSKYDQYKFEAIIGTNVSYSPFVQGPKGTQSKTMANIGWRGVDTVANEQLPRIQEELFAAVKRAIGAA